MKKVYPAPDATLEACISGGAGHAPLVRSRGLVVAIPIGGVMATGLSGVTSGPTPFPSRALIDQRFPVPAVQQDGVKRDAPMPLRGVDVFTDGTFGEGGTVTNLEGWCEIAPYSTRSTVICIDPTTLIFTVGTVMGAPMGKRCRGARTSPLVIARSIIFAPTPVCGVVPAAPRLRGAIGRFRSPAPGLILSREDQRRPWSVPTTARGNA